MELRGAKERTVQVTYDDVMNSQNITNYQDMIYGRYEDADATLKWAAERGMSYVTYGMSCLTKNKNMLEVEV